MEDRAVVSGAAAWSFVAAAAGSFVAVHGRVMVDKVLGYLLRLGSMFVVEDLFSHYFFLPRFPVTRLYHFRVYPKDPMVLILAQIQDNSGYSVS